MANAHDKRARRGGSEEAGPRPRILRIGILLGDTFIEERLVRDRTTVSVGQSAKNTFSIPIEGLPKGWPLFALENDRYVLKFSDRMDGRVSQGGKPKSLAKLRESARRTDDHWSLPLEDTARGKIELGEMRLLFQFVAAPPLQPRPRLPASVRGTLADRIDPKLALILAISVIVHFAVALYAYQHDQTKERYAERRLREFRQDTFKERTITFEAATTTEGEAAATEGEEAEAETEPSKPARRTEDTGGGGETGDEGAPDDAAIDEAIQNTALMGVLGAGEGEEGRYSKAADIDQGSGLDKGLEDIRKSGKEVSGRGRPGDRRARGPSSGKIGGEKGEGKIEGARGGGETAAKKEEKIASRASFSGVDDLSLTTLDPNQVARRIRSRYLRGIKLCHERVLKVNPKAGGRVQLRFTVGPTGRVTRSSAKGFDPTVDACIEGQMRRWRFGTPKSEEGQPSSADFSIPLVLKPGT